MSLINEMLRDLDKRKKQGKRPLPCHENPVAVSERPLSPMLLLLGGGVLLLAGAIWGAITFIPGSLPAFSQKTSSEPAGIPVIVVEKEINPAIVAGGEVDEKLQLIPLATDIDSAPVIVENRATTLLGLRIVEADATAQLSLSFAQLPGYRLLQNGLGQAQLVISFNNTQIGGDFEIPTLTGKILQRVSLLPQKQALQLLVDLNKDAQVQSFQLIDDVDQGYRLLIDVIVAVEVTEKSQLQTSVPQEKSQSAEIKQEINAPEKSKVSRNKNILSRDQQAYRAGLKYLEQENWIVAEENFNQALTINPSLVDARLRLVGVLQQQMQLDKAEKLLLQGLQLTPENSDLRKVYARLLLKDQRYVDAIKLLKAAPVPVIAQDLEYHALLAALLQESKQFEAASQVYSQLLQVRPQSALWWMGMAISQEQLGNSENARNAYQKALNLKGLRPDLQNYIQSRLQVL